MEPIGQILTNTITGLKSRPEPTPDKCQFCGTVLPYEPINHPFKEGVVITWAKPDRCKCPEAQKFWAEHDETERKRKEKEFLEAQAKERIKRIDQLFNQSNMGQRFINRTFSNFKLTRQNKESFETCKEYAENFLLRKSKGQGLFLSGPVGTGKTHLSASIANHLIQNLTPVIFGNITSLLGRIRDTYNGNGKEAEIIDSLIKADLLVIDDLGKEQTTEWVLSKLYEIINARYEDYKPIIVTSNLNPAELEEKIGQASFSRLVEMCEAVQMDWGDYRKSKLA